MHISRMFRALFVVPAAVFISLFSSVWLLTGTYALETTDQAMAQIDLTSTMLSTDVPTLEVSGVGLASNIPANHVSMLRSRGGISHLFI